MSKGLKSLNEMIIHMNNRYAITQQALEDFRNVYKELKALEIIKEKRVGVCYFMNCRTLEEYNDDVLGSYAYEEDEAEQRMLTKEQYDLLKEVLL